MTADPARPILVVTGPSGAGRSTALRALEDLGYEVTDNLPLSLLPRLTTGDPHPRPLALTLDIRNRDFSPGALQAIRGEADIAARVLYLDCREDVLIRRYSETRRRHPMAPDHPPEMGIAREAALLEPFREAADISLDTSEMTPHDLRATIERWFAGGADPGLGISVESFSYRRGLAPHFDLVFDVRFLANPHWVEELRPLDGRDGPVARHVAADPRYADFFDRLRGLILSLLPAYADEGKTHITIGLGCTGGRHRSVAVAENLARALAEAGWRVSIRHREMDPGGVRIMRAGTAG